MGNTKYLAVSWGTPSGFGNMDNAPIGVILYDVYANKTPNRQRIQNKLENKGFRGYITMIKASKIQGDKIQGTYIYK